MKTGEPRTRSTCARHPGPTCSTAPVAAGRLVGRGDDKDTMRSRRIKRRRYCKVQPSRSTADGLAKGQSSAVDPQRQHGMVIALPTQLRVTPGLHCAQPLEPSPASTQALLTLQPETQRSDFTSPRGSKGRPAAEAHVLVCPGCFSLRVCHCHRVPLPTFPATGFWAAISFAPARTTAITRPAPLPSSCLCHQTSHPTNPTQTSACRLPCRLKVGCLAKSQG
jgi:hypothetical protein